MIKLQKLLSSKKVKSPGVGMSKTKLSYFISPRSRKVIDRALSGICINVPKFQPGWSLLMLPPHFVSWDECTKKISSCPRSFVFQSKVITVMVLLLYWLLCVCYCEFRWFSIFELTWVHYRLLLKIARPFPGGGLQAGLTQAIRVRHRWVEAIHWGQLQRATAGKMWSRQ